MDRGAKLLSEALSRVMREREWKQKDLAEKLGVQPPQISRMLSEGANDPQFKTIIEYAEALQMQPWELMKPPGDPVVQRMDRASLLGAIILVLNPLDESKLLSVLRFIQSLARGLNNPEDVAHKDR